MRHPPLTSTLTLTPRLSVALFAVFVAGCADSLLTPNQPIVLSLGAPSAQETANDDVTFTVSYQGADVVLLTQAQVQVVATGSATATATVAGDDATRTVTLTNITGDGTLGVTVSAGSAVTIRGTLAPETVADWTIVVDNTPPTLSTAISPARNVSITANGQDRDVLLTWDPASDVGTAVVRYEVAIGSTPGASDLRAFADAGANTAFTATGLTMNTGVDYWFAVRAVDRCGNVGAAAVAPVWHPGLCGAAMVALGSLPLGVTPGDLDGDGDQDLAVSTYGAGQVTVLLNDGRGSFTPLTPQATGTDPTDLATADVNGDDTLDLVVCNSGANTVSVFFGNGDGTFGAPQTYATSDLPWWVRVADCDGVNGPDLIVACRWGQAVSVLLNDGDGTFAARVDHATGNDAGGLVVADLDGDGDVDIATASGSDVIVMRNAGDGTFGARVAYAAGNSVEEVVAADLDGDGRLDLAAATSGSLIVLHGTGDLDPTAFMALPGVAIGNLPKAVVTGDLDGDGDQDLIVPDYLADRVQILRNDGSGVLTRTDIAASDSSYGCAAVRMNGNDFLDLVTADTFSARVTVLLDPAAGCVF